MARGKVDKAGADVAKDEESVLACCQCLRSFNISTTLINNTLTYQDVLLIKPMPLVPVRHF